jgi:UDP-4-amino-4,6-dideoxy-N-acetyl-beta-L-altrosamine transaminase
MTIKPYARPDVRQEDINAVCDVLKSQFLTTGPKVPELESCFSRYVNVAHSVACGNGTHALHLASMAIGLKPGDKVIVPAMTFLATANAPRMCGADVIFSDVDPDTGIMTLHHLKEAATRAGQGVVAIYPVHIGGHVADMKAISAYARERGWKIIEDACHALGGESQGSAVGSCAYSDLTCFSLHATKSFTSCEGGVVTTNDEAFANRMRILRNHGMHRDGEMVLSDLALDENGDANPWYYEMSELGNNYRLSDVHAALAICQLSRMDEVRARREEISTRYRKEFNHLSPFLKCIAPIDDDKALLHLFQVLIDFEGLGKTRSALCKELLAKGVGTQVHYIPVPWQPYYVALYGKPNLPGAKSFYERVLALPLYSSLSDGDVDDVIEAVKAVFA